jgi:SET domain-containing protein 6
MQISTYVSSSLECHCTTEAVHQAHVNHGDNLEVNSLRTNLPAGFQILNYYGPLPTSELLRRYGYVTPEHRRYDVVELPWNLVRSAVAQQLNLAEDVLEEIVSWQCIIYSIEHPSSIS